MINVVCEVKNGTLYQVTTWFEIEQNANIKVKGRRSRKIDLLRLPILGKG